MDAIVVLDAGSIIRDINPTAERTFGWSRSKLVGQSTARLMPAAFGAVHDHHVGVHARGGSSAIFGMRRQFAGVRCDGSRFPLEDVERKLVEAHDDMAQMAMTDGLTQLANRRSFDEVADREWRRCARENLPLSVLMVDVDRFKLFNDRYGHPAGDACLRTIAARLGAVVRRLGDLAARYGGGEFVILMPSNDQTGALYVAQRLCAEVQALGIPHEDNSDAGVVTVSIGAATAWPGEPASASRSIDVLLTTADTALYEAKNTGQPSDRRRSSGRRCGFGRSGRHCRAEPAWGTSSGRVAASGRFPHAPRHPQVSASA